MITNENSKNVWSDTLRRWQELTCKLGLWWLQSTECWDARLSLGFISLTCMLTILLLLLLLIIHTGKCLVSLEGEELCLKRCTSQTDLGEGGYILHGERMYILGLRRWTVVERIPNSHHMEKCMIPSFWVYMGWRRAVNTMGFTL